MELKREIVMKELVTLIETGDSIKARLTKAPSAHGFTRMYSLYLLENQDEYYNWKELSYKYLQYYSPQDIQRFTDYAIKFEVHYEPRFISNMIGVLRACETMPTEKMKEMNFENNREEEIKEVERLEQGYLAYRNAGSAKINIPASKTAFLLWHAAACVLFDRWVYPTDEDLVKFQSINAGQNGFGLSGEYDNIYSPYKKLMSRLKDGRNIKRSPYARTLLKKRDGQGGQGKKINIFISYSHADRQWLELLKTHLKALTKYYENVEYWEDTKLRGGDKWREEITKAIDNANVAILLVSTNFLASDFITSDELPPILRKAEEDGTRILPLIVAPCEFEDSELGDFQAINSPDRTLEDLCNDKAATNRVYLDLNKEIKSLIV